jgi:hypothetical protein
MKSPETAYHGSILERYYHRFLPRSAREAIVGLETPVKPLEGFAPVQHYLAPWSNKTPSALLEELRIAYQHDLSEHGGPLSLEFDKHGWKDHGPVDAAFGEFEQRRLKGAVLSIFRNGFDLRLGVPNVSALRRGKEFRFLVRGGVHRVGSMDALGYTHIPVRINDPYFVDIAEVSCWSGVRAEFWPTRDAETYFNHLFDFDSSAWLRTTVA